MSHDSKKTNDDVQVIKVKKSIIKPPRVSQVETLMDRTREERKETMRQVQSIMDATRRNLEDAYQRDITDLRTRLVELEQYRIREIHAEIQALGKRVDALTDRMTDVEEYKVRDLETRVAALESASRS